MHVLVTTHHQRMVRGIFKQDLGQTVSWPPATIHEPRLLAEYTCQTCKIHAGVVTRHQHRVSQTQAGVSQTASHLLTTVMSHSHALNACNHKKFGGTQHQLEYTPHPPTKKASAPDRSLEGYQF